MSDIEFENQKKKRGRKKKKQDKNYFGELEEEAVLKFLAASNPEERNDIYCFYLKEPIEKLVESIINRYKLYNGEMSYEELHTDTISFLNEKIHKYKPSKGRAYSYFGTIVRRKLQANLLNIQKRTNIFVNYSDTYRLFSEAEELADSTYNDSNHLLDSFYYELITIIEDILAQHKESPFLKEKEMHVGLAVVDLMKQKDVLFESIDNNKFAKAQVLEILRKMTGYSTKEITNALNYYKSVYKDKKKIFIEKNEE